MALSPEIWGPHYWFVLFTIALNYPINPNKVTKKKYYDFIQNLPLFIPNEEIGTNFSKLLDTFPVSSYLDSREAFVKWVHFIHNRINNNLDKPEQEYYQSLDAYYDKYKKVNVPRLEQLYERKLILTLMVCFFMIMSIWYLYTRV